MALLLISIIAPPAPGLHVPSRYGAHPYFLGTCKPSESLRKQLSLNLLSVLLLLCFCGFLLFFFNRFLQNNKIRVISPKAFAGLSQLRML